jgi:hypothetical protein
MRTLVLVLLTVLMIPSVSSAHLHKKPHPKIQDHKHNKAMKQAAQDCCKNQNPHHGLLHHGTTPKKHHHH